MAASSAEIIGFCEQFVQLMDDNKTDLNTKGLDVTGWITEITAMKDAAVVDSTVQDDMQAALKVQTKKARDSINLAYETSSTRLDAVMGVLGKTTPLGKQAGRLRSSIIKQSKKKSGGGSPT